eukprot:4485618-Prymnesium_polylepis.1
MKSHPRMVHLSKACGKWSGGWLERRCPGTFGSSQSFSPAEHSAGLLGAIGLELDRVERVE